MAPAEAKNLSGQVPSSGTGMRGERKGANTPTKIPAPKPAPRQSPVRPSSYAAAYVAGRTRSPSPVVATPFAARATSTSPGRQKQMIKCTQEAAAPARKELFFVSPPRKPTIASQLSPRMGTADAAVFISEQTNSPRTHQMHSKLTLHGSCSPSPRHHHPADTLVDSKAAPTADADASLDAELAATLLAMVAAGSPASGNPENSAPASKAAGSLGNSPLAPTPGSVLHSVRSLLREPTTPRAVTALAQQLQLHSSARALSALAAHAGMSATAPAIATTGEVSEEDVIAASLHRRLTGRHGSSGLGGSSAAGGGFAARAASRARHTAAATVAAGETKIQGRTGSYAGMPRPALFLDLPGAPSPFDHTLTIVRAGRQDSPRVGQDAMGVPRMPGSTSAPGHSLLHPMHTMPALYSTLPTRAGHSRAGTAAARVADATNFLTNPAAEAPIVPALSAPAASTNAVQMFRQEVILPLPGTLPKDAAQQQHQAAPAAGPGVNVRRVSCGSCSSISSGGSSIESVGGAPRARRRSSRRKAKKPPRPWYACLFCGLVDDGPCSPTKGSPSASKRALGSGKKVSAPADVAAPEPSSVSAMSIHQGQSTLDGHVGAAAVACTPSLVKGVALGGGLGAIPIGNPAAHRHSGNDDLVMLHSPATSQNGSPAPPTTENCPNHPNHQLPEQELAGHLPTPDQLSHLPLAEMLQALQGVLLTNPAAPVPTNTLSSPYWQGTGTPMGLLGGSPSGITQSGAVRALTRTLRPLPPSASPLLLSPAAARKGAGLRQIVGGGVVKRRSRSRSMTGLPPKKTQGPAAPTADGFPSALGHPVHVVDGKAFALPTWLIHSPRMLSYLPPWERTQNGGSTIWTAPKASTLQGSSRHQSPLGHQPPTANRTPSPLRNRSDAPYLSASRTSNTSPSWRPGGSPCPRGVYYDLQAESKRQGKEANGLWSSVNSLASLTSSAQWSSYGTPQRGTPAAVVIPTSAPAKLRASLAPSEPRPQLNSPVATGTGKRRTSATRSPPRVASAANASPHKPPLAQSAVYGSTNGTSLGRALLNDPEDLILHEARVINQNNSPGRRVIAMPNMSMPVFQVAASPIAANPLWSAPAAITSPTDALLAGPTAPHKRNYSAADILQPSTTIITLSQLIDQAMTEAQKLAQGVSTVANNQQPIDTTTPPISQEAQIVTKVDLASTPQPTSDDSMDPPAITTVSRRCTVEVYASSVAEEFSSKPHMVHFVSHAPHWEINPSSLTPSSFHLPPPKQPTILAPIFDPMDTNTQSDNALSSIEVSDTAVPAAAQLVGPVPAGATDTAPAAVEQGIAAPMASAAAPGLFCKVGNLTRMVLGQLRPTTYADDALATMATAAPQESLATSTAVPGRTQQEDLLVATDSDNGQRVSSDSIAAVPAELVEGADANLPARRVSGSGMMGSIKRFMMRNTNHNMSVAAPSGGSSGGGARPTPAGGVLRPRQQTNDSIGSAHELLPCPPTMPPTIAPPRVPSAVPRATVSLQWEDLESMGDRRSLVMDSVRASASESIYLAPPRDLASAGGHSAATPSAGGGGSGGGSGHQVLTRVREEPIDEDVASITTPRASQRRAGLPPMVPASPDVNSHTRTLEDTWTPFAGAGDTPNASQRAMGHGISSPAGASVASRSRAVTPTPAGLASPLRTASRASSSHLLRAALDPLATGIPCDWSSASLLQYEATLSNVQALLDQQEER